MINLTAVLNLEDRLSGPLSAINNKLVGFAGFAAVTAGATSAVKGFATLDTSVRKAATIAGATDAQFTQMADSAMELGAATSLSSTEVADAMTELAAKGYDATQTIAAMPGIIAGAEASGEDLALVADTVATAINIWGMEAGEASRVSDILAMTANKTAAGVADMQYALKYAGAPAKALGMSLEEVSAAAGLLVNAGIDGSSAGTALRQGLSQLVSPSKAAAKQMAAVGFSATDAKGNMKSMEEIVASLQGGLEGMSEAERVTSMKSWVGTESMSAFLALVDAGPEALKELQKELENSEGSAQEAADKMKAGIGGALQQASGAIDVFSKKVGASLAPAVTEFANFIANADTQPMIDAMQSLADKVTVVAKFIIDNFNTIKNVVLLLTYAFVGLKVITTVVRIVMTLINIFKKLKWVISVIKIAFNILKIAMRATPFGWIATAILGLIGFGVKLAKTWDSTKSVWENVWTAIKQSASDSINFVISGINKMITLINKLPGVNIPVIAKVDWGYETSSANKVYTQSKADSQTHTGTAHAIGNHAGVSDIRGTTIRKLHDGERVLTAVENANYKELQKGNVNAIANAMHSSAGFNTASQQTSAPASNINVSFSGATFTVREEADIEKIAGKLAEGLARYV